MGYVIYKSWRDFDMAGWRWPHFHPAEFACKCAKHCAGLYHHDPDFLDKLEALRDFVGRAIKINSGTRCALHNAAVGGAPLSWHKKVAVDIGVAGWSRTARALLLMGVRKIGFGGIGYARTFLHLDPRPKPTAWEYQKGGMKAWTSLL